MSLQFQAGDRAGDCYPDGLLLAEVFGDDDRAGGVYLADMYAGRNRVCRLIESDDCDEGCPGTVDYEDLSEVEYARYEALCAIRWKHSDDLSIADLPNGQMLTVKFNESFQIWTGRGPGSGVIDNDRFQVCARLAAAYVDAKAAA